MRYFMAIDKFTGELIADESAPSFRAFIDEIQRRHPGRKFIPKFTTNTNRAIVRGAQERRHLKNQDSMNFSSSGVPSNTAT